MVIKYTCGEHVLGSKQGRSQDFGPPGGGGVDLKMW